MGIILSFSLHRNYLIIFQVVVPNQDTIYSTIQNHITIQLR
jgi:hypothetical protein